MAGRAGGRRLADGHAGRVAVVPGDVPAHAIARIVDDGDWHGGGGLGGALRRPGPWPRHSDARRRDRIVDRPVAAVSEARHTVRNAGWLVLQRGLHLVTATLFALLVPRLMGPELFGRYALLTSVSMWFAMLSGLGAVSLMTRIVPQFTAAGDLFGLRKLITNLLVLRV